MVSKVEQSYYQYYAVHEEEKRPKEVELVPMGSGSVRSLELAQQAEYIQNQLEASGLRNVLHRSIQGIHQEAKNNRFLNELILGEMSCSKAYVVYLCNLYHLHTAIERAQEAIVAKYGEGFFVFPVLFRSNKLLQDIKLWSILNPTAPRFADKEIDSPEFLKNVEGYVQPCVFAYTERLDALVKEDPILAIGAIYTLYGTIMSGGQQVRRGVKEAFLSRLEGKIEAYHEGTLNKDPDEACAIKSAIIEKVIKDPEEKERLAERCVSFFTLEFDIREFKKTWHNALDQIPAKLGLSHEFEERMSKECVASVRIVLDAIVSFLEFLKKE